MLWEVILIILKYKLKVELMQRNSNFKLRNNLRKSLHKYSKPNNSKCIYAISVL